MTRTRLSGIAEAQVGSNGGCSLRKVLKTMASRDQEQAEEYLPSDEDISFYDKHGYWVSPVIIPDAILAVAERGMARFYADDVDKHLALDSAPPTSRALGLKPYSHWGWRPEDGNVMRKNDYTTLRVRELAELARYPLIAACAARLSGAASLRLWHDQLLYKPTDTEGDAGNVAWHTDRYFWQTCSSENMLTAWIPFADVSRSDGAMSMVDGSNRWTDQLQIKWESAPFLGYQRGVGGTRRDLGPDRVETWPGKFPSLQDTPWQRLESRGEPAAFAGSALSAMGQ